MSPSFSSSTPFIGQIVDYYPSNSQRQAAIVSEVHPASEGDRPKVDLFIFGKGEMEFLNEVLPVQENYEGSGPILEGRWGFAHEFSLEQSDDYHEDSSKGSETNRFVGYVGMVA